MKKNISINLQGMIFHIEEDGYEVLHTYLNSIKIYFSGYAGHQEIIADIESRMAELFYANLTPSKQVITLEDVEALIKKMGSVNDFAQHDKDEDEMETPKMIGNTASGSGYSSTSASSAESAPKRLYRDGNRKVIAGVAAGIADYLNTDPIWIRLILIVLVLIAPVTAGISAGFVMLSYILCWIALPVNYNNPTGTYATDTTSRKLFRNPDDKKLGGVCSGLALYLGMDPTVMRLLFLILLFVGGGGLLLYLILWIVLPEARTVTDKAQMQGKPLTLSGIENSLKNSLQPDRATQEESPLVRLVLLPVRLIAQILVVLSRALGPILNALLIVVRIFAGVLVLILAFAGIVSLVSLLGISLGLLEDASYIHLDNMPANFFFSDYPTMGKIAAFLTGLIPCLFLIILGIGLLSKQFFMRAAVSWSLFAVWLLSGFIFLFSLVGYHKNFEETGTYVSERSFPITPYQTVALDANKIKGGFSGDFDIEVESYAGTDIKLVQQFGAEGRSEEDAVKNAQMVVYRVVQKDSSLVLDNGYTFRPNALFRDQNLSLKLRLPENKKYRITEDLARLLPEAAFDANYSNEQISKHTWSIKNSLFSCLTCTAADTAELNERNDYGFDHESDDARNFLKDADEFGSDTRTIEAKDFRKISVIGPFYVKVTKGSSFSINTRGQAKDLNDIEYEVDGSELKIYPKNSRFSFIGGSDMDPVYVNIEMPDLTEISLVGSSTGEISGFDPGKFTLAQTGATQCFLRTNARNLDLKLTGASEAVIEGIVNNLEAKVIGGCDLNAGKLKAETADVAVIGGSEAEVFVTKTLHANVKGGSELTYGGNPTTTDIDKSGSGEVTRRNTH
jgi:phage shock protein PspC (stress-responsive transcriptional regulator)